MCVLKAMVILMKYVLGIDFGGGASKATLLSENGKVIATSTVEYPTFYPQSGYVEQNPSDWYNATKENIKKTVEKSGINSSDIAALSLDAATHTAVLADESYNILSPSIYWTDTRSKSEAAFLNEKYGDLIKRTAFHNADTIWTLVHLLWVKNNNPSLWSKVKKIMFAKDYVRHMLTGDYVTDYIEAEGSMLFDYNTLSWSKELCDILELDINMLPKIVKPSDIVGTLTKTAAEDLGLSESTRVLCGTTDTVMEVFAAGAVFKEQMTLKLATAGRICVITDKAFCDEHLINYSHVIDGLWYPGTATKSCASSYRWYRDTFGGDYKELDGKAEEIEIGSDGLIFHPYLNGELTPYGNPSLCASFIGMRAGHTKAHFTRAVLEGVAMSMKDCLCYLSKTGVKYGDSAAIIGGGGKSPLWRKIVSDALNIRLVSMENSDSSFGSAMLAAISAGFFKNTKEALDVCNQKVGETLPCEENRNAYEELFAKYKELQRLLAPYYGQNEV